MDVNLILQALSPDQRAPLGVSKQLGSLTNGVQGSQI